MFDEVFSVICALLGVIGLIFLAFYAYSWLNKHRVGGLGNTQNRAIKIVEYVGIAQDKQLMIVTVGSKKMLLGVTANAVTKICDLDDEDLLQETGDTQPENGFMQSLKKAFTEKNRQKADIESTIDEKNEDGRNENNVF